jgi:hypothetical protein
MKDSGNPVTHLIINASVSDHVSEDAIKEFEKIILSDPRVQSSNSERVAVRFLGAFVWRLYEHVASKPSSPARRFLSFPIKGEYFAVLMGLRLRKCMPYFAFSRRKHLYIFDAWPQYHDQIREFARLYKVSSLLVTSRQVAEQLQEGCQCAVHWIPEGIAPSSYRFCDYQDKNIDVLEFGRKHLPYHQTIRDFLAKQGKVHLYEKSKGDLVFPTRKSFIDGLARSKISICIPSNITHPERSGNVETMTIRYLQSMISKCLIVGHAPSEMVQLFGYNPVVEIDNGDPCAQLSELLNRYEDFIPLIERNYGQVIENHTWARRWETITRLIF